MYRSYLHFLKFLFTFLCLNFVLRAQPVPGAYVNRSDASTMKFSTLIRPLLDHSSQMGGISYYSPNNRQNSYLTNKFTDSEQPLLLISNLSNNFQNNFSSATSQNLKQDSSADQTKTSPPLLSQETQDASTSSEESDESSYDSTPTKFLNAQEKLALDSEQSGSSPTPQAVMPSTSSLHLSTNGPSPPSEGPAHNKPSTDFLQPPPFRRTNGVYIPGKPYRPPSERPPKRLPPSIEPPAKEAEAIPYYPVPPPAALYPLPPPLQSEPFFNQLSTLPLADRPSPKTTTNAPQKWIPNRVKGKPKIVCGESGSLRFAIDTLFPFTGQIFAQEKKTLQGCFYAYENSSNVNVSFRLIDCGVLKELKETNSSSSKHQTLTQFYIQIIVLFEQTNNGTTIQSYVAECTQQDLSSQEPNISRRIEEAFDELKLIPQELEQKARHPEAYMKILTNSERNKVGDGVEISEADIGQSLRLELGLRPETGAYDFIVQNCNVKHPVNNVKHQLIDQNGCSLDTTIFSHPKYDLEDVAKIYWNAFKFPDQQKISISCKIRTCIQISDDEGLTNCELIPKPPFCPKVTTYPPESITLKSSDGVKRSTAIRRRSLVDDYRQKYDELPPSTHSEHLSRTSKPSFDIGVHTELYLTKQESNITQHLEQPTTASKGNHRKFWNEKMSNHKLKPNHLMRAAYHLDICISQIMAFTSFGFCACLFFSALFLNLYTVFYLRKQKTQVRENNLEGST